MGFGKKVRIARPPPGFEAWTDKKAEMVTLLPIAKHPLLYEVRDENGKSLTLPANALEPCKIEREEGGEEYGGYLTVNDLMYCPEHELEVCGKCGVDHRGTNFLHECKRDNNLEILEEWLEDMTKIGAPPRQAPKKKGKADFPGNPAVFQPAVSDHLLLLSQKMFDPSKCNPWPPGMITETALRMHVFNDADGPMPELSKLPIRRVRETLVALARMWDKNPKSSSEPMARMMLQDEAQTHVLSLDLVLPIRTMMVEGRLPIPVFAVRWMLCRATDGRRAFQALLESMEPGTKMGDVEVEVDEIQFVAEFLEENTKRMDTAFVRKEKKKHLSVSVLTPISGGMQDSHYNSLRAYCHQCGTSRCDMMKCSRCRKVQYCSRSCQKTNLRFHRKNCSPVGK